MSEETENYICPDCGGPLEFSHEDDLKQKWYRCSKCGKQTNSPRETSPSNTTGPEVSFSELKNGSKGISIGEEDIFIQITKKKKLWKLKVQDIFSNDDLTGWVKLLDFGDLRHSQRAKVIRNLLKNRWPKHISKIVEQIIIQVEEYESEWQTKKDSQTEETKSRFSEGVEGSIQIELAKIVDARNQMQMLKPHLDNVIVKEEDNKKAISVLLTGSKFSDVAKKQIILLKGTEGGGKSTLARELCRSYRVKEVGRFSAHALDYSNLKGFDVLLLKELGAMDMEKQGVSTLKFLSSDDRGYTVEITVKDEETGRFTTEQRRIPCMTVVSTTTRLILDSQFERRAWLFNVDESKEQNKEVVLWKAKRKRQQAEKLLGLREITDFEFSREVLKRFVEQLSSERIIIPFPETLTEVLGYDVLRVRGDLDKIYAFVELYGLFNLKRLQKLKDDVYALTPEVAAEGIQFIVKPLTNMLSKMDERTNVILEALKKIIDVKLTKDAEGNPVENKIKYCVKGSQITKKVRDRIAVETNNSERTVRKFFNFLSNTPYVSSDNKKPKTYTLLVDIKTIEEKLSGILDRLAVSNLLIFKMEKEAQKLLKNVLDNKLLRKGGVSFLDNTSTQKELSPFQKKTLSNTKPSQNQPSLSEISSEDWTGEECPIIHREKSSGVTPDLLKMQNEKLKNVNVSSMPQTPTCAKDGNVLFACPFCAAFNKQMFFNSEEDLKLHILRLHSGS